jgi:anti-anti-sigma factor
VRHPLEIDVIPDGHAVTLRLVGELDMATVPTLRACVENVDSGFGTIILDLSALKFLDSSGIGFVAWLHRELQPQLRSLELWGATNHVQHVLDLSGLSQVIGQCDDLEGIQ